MLRELLGRRRLLLNDSPRRRLAVTGKTLGRKLLGESASYSLPTPSCAGIANLSRSTLTLAVDDLIGRTLDEFKKLVVADLNTSTTTKR